MVERITSRSANASYTAGIEGASSPSASGSEDVLRVARPPRPRTGLRWARSTEADGEGDVREACDTESAPAALDKGPLIDGCLKSLGRLTAPVHNQRHHRSGTS